MSRRRGRAATVTILGLLHAVSQNRALLRVELAFVFFNMAEFGTWVAILVFAYGASGPGLVGWVALAQLLPAAVVTPFTSALADHFRRDRVLIGGYAAQALAFAAAGSAMVTGASLVLVYVFAAAAACALTVTRPTQSALFPKLSRTPDELTAANGLAGTLEGVGVVLGPLGAALILGLSSPGTAVLAGALACLFALALSGATDVPRAAAGAPSPAADRTRTESAASRHHSIVAGLGQLKTEPDARLVTVLLGLRMLTSGAMDLLFVFLALEVLATGAAGAGILNAAMGCGIVAGGAVTFALAGRPRMAAALALSAIVWGGAIVLLAATTAPWVATLITLVGGIGYASCDVLGRTVLQRVTRDELLGRVFGALEGFGLLGLATGAIAAQLLIESVGVRWALVVIGLVLPSTVVLARVGLRRIDGRMRVPLRELSLMADTAAFASLPAPTREIVARRSRWLTAAPGEVLIHEGDPGDDYFILESGRVRFTQGGHYLRDLGKRGDGFGEIALLRDVPRTATATALENCVLLAVGRERFLEAVTGHERSREIVEEAAEDRYGTTGQDEDSG
jgi:MFS family permease